MIKHIASTWVLVLLSCGAFAAPVTTLPIRSMYVLGDSLSDQGNLLAATTALTVEGIRDAILALKSAGARTILVPNAPNLGKVPLVTVPGSQAVAFATALSL